MDKATSLDLDPSCHIAVSQNFPFIDNNDGDDNNDDNDDNNDNDNVDGPTVEAHVDLAKKSCKFCTTYYIIIH